MEVIVAHYCNDIMNAKFTDQGKNGVGHQTHCKINLATAHMLANKIFKNGVAIYIALQK